MKKPLRYILVILCLLGISLGSAFVGAKVGFEIARKKYRQRANPEEWHQQAMRVLEERLELKDDQRHTIQALMNTAVERLKKTRRQTLSESGLVVDELFDAVDAELTPQQQVVFRELTKDRDRLKREIIEDNTVRKSQQAKEHPAPANTPQANATLKEMNP